MGNETHPTRTTSAGMERKLAAILSADVKGYSRLMGEYLARYPNILGAHLTLAAVYSELGREVEARAEGAEVLRINPQFSLEVHRQREPIKDPVVLERHLAALRKAGLK